VRDPLGIALVPGETLRIALVPGATLRTTRLRSAIEPQTDENSIDEFSVDAFFSFFSHGAAIRGREATGGGAGQRRLERAHARCETLAGTHVAREHAVRRGRAGAI
jgi:hypothetical protein